MKRLIVIALFLNAFLLAGRILQESNAEAGSRDPSRNGDVNCDGALDLSDAVGILQFLFNGGPEPCAFAGDVGLEDRVRDAERALDGLLRAKLAQHADRGALSLADLRLERKCVETDITALLSEVHAVATAGTDVTVEPAVALEFLDDLVNRLAAVAPLAPLNPRVLNRPAPIARETDAAVGAINVWLAAVNDAVAATRAAFPAALARVTLLQATGNDVGAEVLLDEMVAKNLESLRAVSTSGEFQDAKKSAELLVEAWREKLGAAGDEAELASADLERMGELIRQSFETIAGVSKTIHENAMAVVRKIN